MDQAMSDGSDTASLLHQLIDSVGEIQAGLTQTRSELTATRTELSATRADLTARIDRLQDDLGQTHSDFMKTRTDIMARMDRLQDELTNQLDAWWVQFGASDRAARLAKAAQDEARSAADMVAPLVRQLRRLQDEVRELREGKG